MSKKKICLLGCGWLGLPLASALVKAGYEVNGSTTTPAKLSVLAEAGIRPYLIDLKLAPESRIIQEFTDGTFCLIIAIPAGTRNGQGRLYPEMLQRFFSELPVKKQPQKVIFISSTSVYPDLNREVTEEDTPPVAADSYLLIAENLVQQTFKNQAVVLRFGGLMGPGRQPGRFLAGKINVPNPGAPVNMIHLDDCTGIILKIIDQNNFAGVYNACADLHPTRKDFFTKGALNLGLIPPVFSDEPGGSFKQINSQKLKSRLSYNFIYPDPMVLV